MKELGSTPEGGKIIELTHREATVLNVLQDALEGIGWDFDALRDQRQIKEYEMDDIFLMVREFVAAKFYVNQMREGVDNLDRALIALEHGE